MRVDQDTGISMCRGTSLAHTHTRMVDTWLEEGTGK